MSLLPIKLGLTLIALLALRVLFKKPRRNGWLLLALSVVLAMVWQPDYAQHLASWVGVTRGVDAVIYLAIAILTAYLVRLHALVEAQAQTITQLVSQLAQQDFQRERERTDR